MRNFKPYALFTLSVIFIAFGILGIAGVGFFVSNIGMEIVEIVIGIGGLIAAVR